MVMIWSQSCQQFLGLSAWKGRGAGALNHTGLAVSVFWLLASPSQTWILSLGAENSEG